MRNIRFHVLIGVCAAASLYGADRSRRHHRNGEGRERGGRAQCPGHSDSDRHQRQLQDENDHLGRFHRAVAAGGNLPGPGRKHGLQNASRQQRSGGRRSDRAARRDHGIGHHATDGRGRSQRADVADRGGPRRHRGLQPPGGRTAGGSQRRGAQPVRPVGQRGGSELHRPVPCGRRPRRRLRHDARRHLGHHRRPVGFQRRHLDADQYPLRRRADRIQRDLRRLQSRHGPRLRRHHEFRLQVAAPTSFTATYTSSCATRSWTPRASSEPPSRSTNRTISA